MRLILRILIILLMLVGISTIVPLFLQGEACAKQRDNTWITVQGKDFIKNNASFKFIGASAVNLVFYDDWNLDIEKAIRTAKENNISVVRIYLDWGWSKDEDIDRVIDCAGRYGIYVICSLTDCCCSGDYLNFETYLSVHAPFCNIANEESSQAFKRRMRKIIERKNSINGKIYRDDPTILAWEIANELEYWHFPDMQVHKWIRDMAGYIKTLDKRHLLTIGVSVGYEKRFDDPSFYRIFNVANLDFFSFHFYPSVSNSGQRQEEIQKEAGETISLVSKNFISYGKPVILEEFGFSSSKEVNFKMRTDKNSQSAYVKSMKFYMDAAFRSGVSGVMFWGWGVPKEEMIPMWWSKESHSVSDKSFCKLLKEYVIGDKNKSWNLSGER